MEVCNSCVSGLATLTLQGARRPTGNVGAEVAGASGKHSATILSLGVHTCINTCTSQRHFILLTVQMLPVFHADFRKELGKDDVIPLGSGERRLSVVRLVVAVLRIALESWRCCGRRCHTTGQARLPLPLRPLFISASHFPPRRVCSLANRAMLRVEW